MIPRPLRWLAGRTLRLLPDAIVGRLLPGPYSFSPDQVPAPPVPPATAVRLFVAPVNWAGQGWQWAKAAERNLPGVGSTTMYYGMGSAFGFEADDVVPAGVYIASSRWQRAQYSAVSSGYTHVLIEAERQPFGAILDQTLDAQVAWLRRDGLAIAMLCHGSDIRLPSRHAAGNPDSPFSDPNAPLTRRLEREARQNAATLARLELPVFVSTPDLLIDVPTATWLPVVVDVAAWTGGAVPLQRAVPIVVHAPSKGVIKGSDLIDPIAEYLAREGLIEYRRIEGVAHSAMPEIYASADIVLDQFRIGDYGVAAVEAMAAGRVVISHVNSRSRVAAESMTGLALPIVEATASGLEAALRAVLADRDRFGALAAEGPRYAAVVHDGRASARALGAFLQ